MTESQRTQQFLQHVSRRLSGRIDCKKVEFRVGIGCRFPGADKITAPQILDSRYIFFSPPINVYKDLHHRKELDLRNIVDHVIQEYYDNLILGYDLLGNLIVDTSKFIIGVYDYQLSIDQKRRKWMRNPEFVIESKKPICFVNFVKRGSIHEN